MGLGLILKDLHLSQLLIMNNPPWWIFALTTLTICAALISQIIDADKEKSELEGR